MNFLPVLERACGITPSLNVIAALKLKLTVTRPLAKVKIKTAEETENVVLA